MLYEWKPSSRDRNFGDALGKMFVQEGWREDVHNVYFPIGSVICNETIELVLDYGYTPVFVGCGWRGAELQAGLVHQSTFIGVRGPDTQQELARHGVQVEIVLDPAYELPRMISPAARNNMTLLVPHVSDPMRGSELYRTFGATVVQPTVVTHSDIENLVNLISGAEFVLAGAMHAAIVAHAYGVPFAPFAYGYIDCPPKWNDWGRSVGIKKIEFVQNIADGLEWYEANVNV